MTQRDNMLSGQYYQPQDKELTMLRTQARILTQKFNQTSIEQIPLRTQIIKELFGQTKEHIYIEPYFQCDYGCNIYVGDHFYMNYNCVILDVAQVRIGNHCMIGPQVGIYTATHPIDAQTRNSGVEYAKSITIGDNCWIGGHSVINPGVTLGDNVVVASGAVVTKSFGNNVVIGGNPAKIIKEI